MIAHALVGWRTGPPEEAVSLWIPFEQPSHKGHTATHLACNDT